MRSHSYRPQLEMLENRLTPTTLPTGFSEASIAGGLTRPTAFEMAADGRFFVTEQGGTVRVVNNGTVLTTPLLSLNVDSSGERGLLGITLDPNFSSNGFLYVYYTVPGTQSHNRVSRFTVTGNQAVPDTEFVLLNLPNLSVTATNHNGGALHFGSDGKIYIGVGDNGFGNNSQDLSTPLGKMLRINSNGTVPSDNPFVGTPSADPAVWALGLRNPFTFAVQPGTGRIFINDVGQNAFEEINDGIAGSNYGWPTAEGSSSNPAFRNPLFFYPHGPGTQAGFAITGGTFYNPVTQQFPADLTGDYFFADLVNNWIRRYDVATASVSDFASDLTGHSTVDLKVDAGGNLYYLARGDTDTSGAIFQISFPLGPNRAYVQQLYQDYLGRTGSPADIDFWAFRISTHGRGAVARDIQHSTEALTRRVVQLYQELLGRTHDPNGLAFWVAQLQNQGQTLEQVITGFVTSPEFVSRSNTLIGGSDADANYVRALYKILLRREGAAVADSHVASWLDVLHSSNRAVVANGFLGSLEYRSRAVLSFYGDPTQSPVVYQAYWLNLLHRTSAPSAAHVDSWIRTQLDLFQVETGFASSPEYFARAQT